MICEEQKNDFSDNTPKGGRSLVTEALCVSAEGWSVSRGLLMNSTPLSPVALFVCIRL